MSPHNNRETRLPSTSDATPPPASRSSPEIRLDPALCWLHKDMEFISENRGTRTRSLLAEPELEPERAHGRACVLERALELGCTSLSLGSLHIPQLAASSATSYTPDPHAVSKAEAQSYMQACILSPRYFTARARSGGPRPGDLRPSAV